MATGKKYSRHRRISGKSQDDREKYLGEGFEVVASVGHVRDLPKSNTKAIDIEGGFIPHYEISKGKKEKVVSEIARLAKKSKKEFCSQPTPTVKVKR